MNLLSPFLAVLSTNSLTSLGHTLADGARGYLSLAGALAILVGLILIWAVFFRKRPRGLSRYRSPHGSRDESLNPAARYAEGANGALRKRRRWRRRREHRPCNPTLAETGGLPRLAASRPPEVAR